MNNKISKKISVMLLSATILSSSMIVPVVNAEEAANIIGGSTEVSNAPTPEVPAEELTETPITENVQLSEEEQNAVTRNTDAVKAAADTSITTLMLQVRDTNVNKKTEFSYAPDVNVNNPYQGGELTGYARVPLQGNVYNRSVLPINGPEHIRHFENGNYGARINIVFPKGVDAQAMFNTVDWEKSNQSTNSSFYIKAIGIPTPVKLTWGLIWDRNTVNFNSATPNEFSLLLRGIKKSEVSSAEWEKYNPAVTSTALMTVGTIPLGGVLGNMDGWAEGALSFDISKYTGNKDDITKDKELTKGRMAPDVTRNSKYTLNILDEAALLAGTNGIDDISKSVVKPGHEHDNPQVSNAVPTWDSYLSIWDTEHVYNTNNTEENEAVGENNALPGNSLFNRDLVVNKGDDFNAFNPNRFNRVINYFTKQDVTAGSIGDVNSVSINHLPGKVPDNVKTPVTYTGSVSYYNGDTRQLIPNVLNVTNKSKPTTEGSIKANDYTVGESNITGTYTGDVAKLRLYINGVSVSWGGTVANGKFTFYAANQKIKSTDVVTMNAYDKDDNLLQENAPVRIKDANVAGTISPAEYSIGDTEITGTYTGDVAKARVTINGKAQAWGGTFSGGKFTYYIGAGKIKSGDTVTITAYDKNDKVLDANKPVKIKSNAAQGTITPASYNIGDYNITGTYTGDVAKARVTINGKAQAWGGTFSNGTFSYYIGAGKIKVGDVVTITAYDKDDKILDTNKPVKINNVVQGTITPSVYSVGETTIKGSYTGDIVKARVLINGEPQAWGGTFSNGSFTYYIGAGKIKDTDNVKIVGYSADNSELSTKVVTVQK